MYICIYFSLTQKCGRRKQHFNGNIEGILGVGKCRKSRENVCSRFLSFFNVIFSELKYLLWGNFCGEVNRMEDLEY